MKDNYVTLVLELTSEVRNLSNSFYKKLVPMEIPTCACDLLMVTIDTNDAHTQHVIHVNNEVNAKMIVMRMKVLGLLLP